MRRRLLENRRCRTIPEAVDAARRRGASSLIRRSAFRRPRSWPPRSRAGRRGEPDSVTAPFHAAHDRGERAGGGLARRRHVVAHTHTAAAKQHDPVSVVIADFRTTPATRLSSDAGTDAQARAGGRRVHQRVSIVRRWPPSASRTAGRSTKTRPARSRCPKGWAWSSPARSSSRAGLQRVGQGDPGGDRQSDHRLLSARRRARTRCWARRHSGRTFAGAR